MRHGLDAMVAELDKLRTQLDAERGKLRAVAALCDLAESHGTRQVDIHSVRRVLG